jgi:hypothetical protein
VLVRGRLFGLLLAAVLAFPGSAAAAPVLMLGKGGRVSVKNDPFLTAPALTPAPSSVVTRARRRSPSVRAHLARAPKRHAKRRTVMSELARLYQTGQLDQAHYNSYLASWSAARDAEKQLHGVPASELGAVIANLRAMAAAGYLAATRLPALFLTLDRNREWWSTGQVPATWQRVEFQGSPLVWEYYPGQGIELQVLGTFGKADGLYTGGPADYSQLRELLTEMIPLAAHRAGGLAWEYYFQFDGGKPPWVSAMSQGTGLEALTRAAKAFGPDPYLQIAEQALPLFTVAPPRGVRVSTPHGARYLQYSFTPQTDIINAFLQSLIGLYDYAAASGSVEAQQLFAAGNAQAEAELPQFDTGAWSLYQPGSEDSLDYHVLVTGFLDELCTRTNAPVYCTTASHFHAYLKTPPTLRLITTRATPKVPLSLKFDLSKYSHVGIVVMRGTSTVFQTSASFPYGVDDFAVPSLRSGSYTIHLAATDLAGNFNRIVGTLSVHRRRH